MYVWVAIETRRFVFPLRVYRINGEMRCRYKFVAGARRGGDVQKLERNLRGKKVERSVEEGNGLQHVRPLLKRVQVS